MVLKKLFTFLVLAMFMVIPLASAQYEGLKARDREFTTIYKNQVAMFSKASNEYVQARNEWRQARDAVRKAKNAQNSQLALEKAQIFLSKSIERMQRHLELLLSWSEHVTLNEELTSVWKDEINDDLAALEALQSEVDAADSKQEIIDVSQKIVSHWRSTTKPLIRKTMAYVLSVRMEKVLNRANAMGESIQLKIDAMPDGAKKTELQTLMDKYNARLDAAEAKYETIRDKWSNIDEENVNNFGSAKTIFVEINQILRETHDLLKQIVIGYRDSQGSFPVSSAELSDVTGDKTETISGEGVLTATGSGRAVLVGQADLITLSGWGTVSVEDLGGDAQIEVSGFGDKVMTGNREKYGGKGTITVTGSNVVVKFSGTHMVLRAEGSGTATLSGHGTWNKGTKSGQLTVEGISVAELG